MAQVLGWFLCEFAGWLFHCKTAQNKNLVTFWSQQMIEDETATSHSKDIGVDHDRKKQSLNCILNKSIQSLGQLCTLPNSRWSYPAWKNWGFLTKLHLQSFQILISTWCRWLKRVIPAHFRWIQNASQRILWEVEYMRELVVNCSTKHKYWNQHQPKACALSHRVFWPAEFEYDLELSEFLAKREKSDQNLKADIDNSKHKITFQ